VPTAFVTGGSGFIGGALIRRLRAEGWGVRALARSDSSAAVVADRGAEPVRGDLQNTDAMRSGAEGCELAFHAAAHVGEWGSREEFHRDNVDGTVNALEASRAAGVRRFVHVGTEAALMSGRPLVGVDEQMPVQPHSRALYSASKARAELAVRAAAGGNGFETVVVRPRLVWGVGDTTILPSVREAAERGRWAWIGGGRHLTSTTHVDNVVEGLWLGATKGESGGVYFVTDGEPVVFRDFMTRLLGTHGVELPDKNVPTAVAGALASVGETAWKMLRIGPAHPPPVTRLAYWLASQECTIDTTRARTELGYAPVKTIDDGMEELARAHSDGV
jgi:nucleoside-diphosphate-sugar epimerase